MPSHPLDHVSAWLDGSASDDSMFAHAMEWAFRLTLPLRVVVTARPNHPEQADRSHGPHVEKMKSLSAACAQRGIVLELVLTLETGQTPVPQFLRPHGLCLFPHNVASPFERELLFRSGQDNEIALLICPSNSAPMTRIMILHDQANARTGYLENAARLCKALDMDPVILTVADTEREADLRQGYTEAVCKAFRLLADFDIVVGSNLQSAVRHAATWRSCSHVIIERRIKPPWWHFTHGDAFEQLRGLADSLNILAFPESLTFESPRKIRGNSVKLPIDSHAGTNPKSNKEYA